MEEKDPNIEKKIQDAKKLLESTNEELAKQSKDFFEQHKPFILGATGGVLFYIGQKRMMKKVVAKAVAKALAETPVRLNVAQYFADLDTYDAARYAGQSFKNLKP